MIQLSAAGKRFGHKLLFEHLDWLITPNDRVGVVGANGTGKSTLLKILAGIESLDYGNIVRTRGISAGYLPQDGLSLSGRTVFSECMSVFDEIRTMEQELEQLTARMSELDHEGVEYEQVANRFHTLESQFRAHDGYALEAQVGAVLTGLGFGKQDWQRGTEEFSGGWQMRIALAKLLLQKPNLLLLDEPTNHLDLETRNWLEDYLAAYPHAFVLISHDRYFLDVTVTKTTEIWNRRVQFYSGNYEKYLAQRQERKTQLESTYRNQRDKIEQLEAFINRFRYQATKAKQVQSRIKELERMERIEIPPEEKTIHFHFPKPKSSGRTVAEFKNVGKSYDSKEVFLDVSFMIERGDRIALVGANGAGKSTLIRMLSGTEPLSSGEYVLGHNAEPDYFAQDQYKVLNPESRMLDDLEQVAPRSTMTELRNLLGCFLFSDDDVFKTLGVLSGGERNRYALARMLLNPSNFLLLDEPTNHLDLRAKDVLLNALQEFSGTVVFVSHDRYFIDKLATRVFEVGGGKVEIFAGNYEDYLWRKQVGTIAGNQAGASAAHAELAAMVPDHSTPGKNGAPLSEGPSEVEPRQKRINPIKLRQMKQRAREIEEEITKLEAGIAECEQALQSFVSAQETAKVTDLLKTRRSDLETLMKEWEEVSAVIEGV